MTTLTNQELPEYEALSKFAHKMADQSSVEIMRIFRQMVEVTNKMENGGFDPVTQADRKAEQVMRDLVSANWPDHDFYGEEFENLDRNAEYQWCVDPIDGTRAFIMGYPQWGTLIGLKKSGAPYFGLMNQPFTGERFWSTERHALYRGPDGERLLNTRSCPQLSDAILSTTSPDLFEAGFEIEKFREIADKSRLTHYGGDCYTYCMLASGFVDVVIEAGLKPFDIMALIPIVERAGGNITTWSGGDAAEGGRILATGDPALHDKILDLLNS